tara:strand:+ start:37660 stop:38148 length:489 start_codon:yes stop_codon:yes gene_type:complete
MKHEILTRLRNGDEPKAVAEELGASIATVVRYRTELNNAIKEGKLNTLLASAAPSAAQMVEALYEDAPPEVKSAAGELSKGMKALERLQPELIDTANEINRRIVIMCGTAESVSEIEILTGALCKLQTAFFPTAAGPATQVNIQNNGGTSYGEWLSDKPGAV